MKSNLELNIYQLPGNVLSAKQNVTGWGMKKIMDFAKVQLIEYNRFCCIADDAGGPLDGLKVRTHIEEI
uniref:Uncharacterized protein n=1 Tax=viral metagenome TaxID=1070528 RepID=A0A6M3ILN4_9ZZZZ